MQSLRIAAVQRTPLRVVAMPCRPVDWTLVAVEAAAVVGSLDAVNTAILGPCLVKTIVASRSVVGSPAVTTVTCGASTPTTVTPRLLSVRSPTPRRSTKLGCTLKRLRTRKPTASTWVTVLTLCSVPTVPTRKLSVYGDRFRWDNGWNSATTADGEALYGTAIPQAYLTAAWGDWEVKMGHFYTIIGYEVVQAPDNFFTSYAYTMNYGEPFTHGGVLATYSGIDDTTLWAGYVNGWDTAFDNYEAQSTFLGGISRDLSDSTTFTWAVNAGDWGKTNTGNIYMNSFVLTHDMGCGWSYVFQHDLGVQSAIPGAENNYWYGVNQYLFKEINDCWSAGIRAEWFCDEDGSRVGNGPGSYYATTVGLNWKPNANLIVRPEVRFEKFDAIHGGNGTPYAEGTHDDCVFAGFDAIFMF